MLPNNFRTPSQEDREWPTIPDDVYQVIIEDINPVEAAKWNKPEEKEIKLNFQFLILDDGEYKGQRLFKRVSQNVFDGADTNRPSYLYQLYKAAMKAEPTDKQMEEGLTGAELNALIGKQLRVVVKVSAPNAKGRVYSNVEGITSAKSDMPAPKLNAKSPANVSDTGKGPFQTPSGSMTDDDIPVIGDEDEPAVTEKDLPF